MAVTRQPAAGHGAAGDHAGRSTASRNASGADRNRRPRGGRPSRTSSTLGYEVGLEPDGWSYARHPYRYNFSLRTFPSGTNLHCEVDIGASIGNSRAAWIDFLNQANDRGHVTRFSFVEYANGVCRVKMRALVPGAYDRKAFAMVMDMWHDDLDIVRRRPEFPLESSSDEHEDAAAVTVN